MLGSNILLENSNLIFTYAITMKVTNKKKSKHRGYHGYEPGPYDTPDKLREKGSKPYENPVGKKVNTRVDVP